MLILNISGIDPEGFLSPEGHFEINEQGSLPDSILYCYQNNQGEIVKSEWFVFFIYYCFHNWEVIPNSVKQYINKNRILSGAMEARKGTLPYKLEGFGMDGEKVYIANFGKEGCLVVVENNSLSPYYSSNLDEAKQFVRMMGRAGIYDTFPETAENSYLQWN